MLTWLLTAGVIAGALPLLAGCYQFVLAGLHRFRYRELAALEHEPNVAIVVPAWNEAAVIGRTIDTLLALDYPPERLRVYIVDDASTDETPAVVAEKAAAHPGRVIGLRRAKGGEGKAHTLNHGLREIRAEGWYEAVLIIDADVIFTAGSLRKLVRHLADPTVGAVTGYIKEGSRPSNYMNRFVSFEYISAQAGARRAQNVLGAQACLAGGAQLLRREALEAIGGEIDTSSLAEDTFTTFNVQLSGRRVVFEPHAIVWAEEPRDIAGLWKQRLRWGRGNVQVTLRYRRYWLRRKAGKLGGLSFALIWFAIFLMPALMVISSASLVALFALDRELSIDVFRSLWALNLLAYLFVTLAAFAYDGPAARRSWLEAITFPGLVSLAIIVWTTIAPVLDNAPDWLLLFTYVWLSASMLAAYLVRCIETLPRIGWLARPLLYVVGFGPLLCVISATAYVAELRRAEMKWEKTEKTGTVGDLA
ncbi:glycosyltransferase family 2 protein [Solirubrobacter taibaiensis]|nr:glycosyltransferase family 2 protein [Solirubrobacter taibaiensis]